VLSLYFDISPSRPNQSTEKPTKGAVLHKRKMSSLAGPNQSCVRSAQLQWIKRALSTVTGDMLTLTGLLFCLKAFTCSIYGLLLLAET
jgi:hypothetical protein